MGKRETRVSAALGFGTSRRVMRELDPRCAREKAGWPTRVVYLSVRALARALAKDVVRLQAELAAALKREAYLVGLRQAFEREVDSLEAQLKTRDTQYVDRGAKHPIGLVRGE
jgi:hypothetical protein